MKRLFLLILSFMFLGGAVSSSAFYINSSLNIADIQTSGGGDSQSDILKNDEVTAQAPTNSGYWTDAGNYATAFAGGSGTSTDPYLISTPQQLAYLSYLINTTSGNTSATYGVLYYRQTANIDCSLYYWDPIGYHANYSFRGNYDGGGYTVSGLYTISGNDSTYSYQGLFGYLYSAIVHDILIANSDIRGNYNVGAIAGCASLSTIYNCYNYGNVTAENVYSSGSSNIGGIVGTSNSISIHHCYNYGNIKANQSYVGGIVGYFYISSSGEIQNCYNTGEIIGEDRVGGIIGEAALAISDLYEIYDCYNEGNIIGSTYVGGIAGISCADVYNCYNIGVVESDSYAGGVVGSCNSYISVYNCYNLGEISATTSNAGGITGNANARNQIYSNYNEGYIVGNSNVGGIAGKVDSEDDLSIYDCYNTGKISGESELGGIVGYLYNTGSYNIYLSNCYNIGIISGERHIGGIVGYLYNQYYTYTYIFNCYNVGAISGNTSSSYNGIGSIVGFVNFASRYTNLYLYNNYFGGDCTISSIFGCDSGSGTTTERNCGSCTIDNAKDVNWYTNSSNWHSDHPWDFENTWGIDPSMNDGYPILMPTLEIMQFTITYHPNGASGSEVVESKTGSESYTIRSNMFSRSGYNFTGWNTQANGGGQSYSAGASYSDLANLDLYAQWSRITYTITYNKNASDATGTMANTTKYYGTNVTLRSNAFKRTGYSFAGWATRADGDKVYNNGATYTANANVTLYAKWTAHKYTVKFNGNGSTSGSMSNQTFTYGTAQKLASNAFKKTGFTFSKWTRNADGTGASYTNGQSVSNLTSSNGATINLYAQWKANNEAKYDSAGKYWYVENGKIPQTKVTNSTLISNLNKATTNGANYYIAGQTLTAKVYSGKEYCKWNNNWYEVEPIKWRLDYSSSQKDGYGTTTDTNAVLAEIVYVDQYSSSSIDAGEGYSNQSVTDFMRNGISTTYLVNYATSTQTFGTGASLYGTNASTTARMFVSSQSEINAVNGTMNITFSDLVEDMIKYYGGTNSYFTRDLGSNYNNITCINAVGKEIQRFATDYRGLQFTVRFTEYGCVA